MWMFGQVFICTDSFGTAFFLKGSLKKLVKKLSFNIDKAGKLAIMQIGIESI